MIRFFRLFRLSVIHGLIIKPCGCEWVSSPDPGAALLRSDPQKRVFRCNHIVRVGEGYA